MGTELNEYKIATIEKNQEKIEKVLEKLVDGLHDLSLNLTSLTTALEKIENLEAESRVQKKEIEALKIFQGKAMAVVVVLSAVFSYAFKKFL